MATTLNVHDLKAAESLPTRPSTQLKNAYKDVFLQALAEPVSITRNNRREAVLISKELYDQIVAALSESDPLAKFAEDYDRMFQDRAPEEVAKAYNEAIWDSPEAYGKSALDAFKQK